MNQKELESRLATCTTLPELREVVTELKKADPVLTAAHAQGTMYNRAKNARAKEIRVAELEPFHQDAKRWKHGDKVFFGKSLKRDFMDWNFNFQRGERIEKGQWCKVYCYQPRKKLAWIGKPMSKTVKRGELICLSLRDIIDYQVSRTELEIRK
jgi:hypothetical protein